jgi:glycolate oxidase
MMLDAAVRSGVVRELGNIVGEGYVSTNKADLYIHAQDMTPADLSWPDVVVLPASVEEVQAIVRLANREKLPLTPYVAGGSIGGLSIPLKNGISMDLKRMDRVLEVSEEDMYAVVEPGVTFGLMKAYLEKNHPGLVYTYAFSPPSTGVMTNCLLQGLDNFSFRYGAASAWVSSLEVVLPDGELVRVGSCAAGPTWQALVPFPELAGLFLGWQGATGVITKMAVSVWPKPRVSSGISFLMMDLEGADRMIKLLARTRLPDDLIGTSFQFMRWPARLPNTQGIPLPGEKPAPDEPEMSVTVSLSANTDAELKAKETVIAEVVASEMQGYAFMGPNTSPGMSAHYPMQLLDVLSSGGGLTWVGSYGPMRTWLETMRRGLEIEDRFNLTRSGYTRIMNEGHFRAVRWLLPYDKGNPEDVARIRDVSAEQLRMILETGYMPYKTPVWAMKELKKQMDPNLLALQRRIKQMLDPNDILNPGRWGAPEE